MAKSAKLIPVAMILLCSLAVLTSAKVVRKTFTVKNLEGETKWQYLTKFTLDLGEGKVFARVRLLNVPQTKREELADQVTWINLNVVYDDQWEHYSQSDLCANDWNNNAHIKEVLKFSPSGDWSDSHIRSFRQPVQNHIWYFTINDCKGTLRSQLGAQDHWKVQVELEVKNTDGSQFSYDQQNFFLPYLVLYLTSFTFLFLKGKEFYRGMRRSDGEDIDYPFLLGLVSLLFQNGSFLLELIHLNVYKNDGEGILFFQVLSQIAMMCSQLTITVFLVLISWGWTLTYRRLRKCELYIPLLLGLTVIHIVLAGLSNVDGDSPNQYHAYDGISGIMTLIIRLALFAYYIFGIRDTEKAASDQIKDFINQFKIFGGLYFLAFPLLVIVANFCDGYIRHKVVTIGGLFFQTLSIATIIYINSNQNSLYYKASQKSHALLPNAKED